MDDQHDKIGSSYLPHGESDITPIDFEGEPITRAEYISTMVHFYRGELQRTLEWRKRLDNTTHWALITTIGLLTFSFSNPQFAQETLITGMYATFMYLLHESRRFRFFDMWRSRLRMLEENFYGPMLRRDPHSPMRNWGDLVAEDLLHPKFKITRLQAMRARLRRNYGYLFGFFLLAWLARAAILPEETGDASLHSLFAMGVVPWWVPVLLVGGLYLFLVALMIFTPPVIPPEQAYWPDPKHSGEDVPSLDA